MSDVTGKNPFIRRYFEVLLLNLSVEFVIKAENIKIENKHMTAMFAAFKDMSLLKNSSFGNSVSMG